MLCISLTDMKKHGCHSDPPVKVEGPDDHKSRAIAKERQWEYQRILVSGCSDCCFTGSYDVEAKGILICFK